MLKARRERVRKIVNKKIINFLLHPQSSKVGFGSENDNEMDRVAATSTRILVSLLRIIILEFYVK